HAQQDEVRGAEVGGARGSVDGNGQLAQDGRRDAKAVVVQRLELRTARHEADAMAAAREQAAEEAAHRAGAVDDDSHGRVVEDGFFTTGFLTGVFAAGPVFGR